MNAGNEYSRVPVKRVTRDLTGGGLILILECGHTARIATSREPKDYQGRRHICYACPCKKENA